MRSLSQWLEYQQRHYGRIELGLERVSRVWGALGAGRFDCPVVVVGGTNGKGSTVCYLRHIYQRAGYRVAAYTSPHLLRYNERVVLDGAAVSDAALVAAFERVEAARAAVDTALTYFEYGTLAALWLFVRARPEVVLLEVGMGGRLDAVNILDHDVAVITNVALDHQAWLGADIESIAFEKVGIARAGKPLIYGDAALPRQVRAGCREHGARLLALGRDFFMRRGRGGGWRWSDGEYAIDHITPGLRGRGQPYNAAAALCVTRCLRERLPAQSGVARAGLAAAALPGRLQTVASAPEVILDVAHNAAAVRELVGAVNARGRAGRKHAVFAMREGRDCRELLAACAGVFDAWSLCPLAGAPCHSPAMLAAAVKELNPRASVHEYDAVAAAIRAAQKRADTQDIIVVFGSFFTVAEAMQCLGV